jgi:nicotinamidase-related amidase
MSILPIPRHFDPDNAQVFGYRPDLTQLALDAFEFKRAHGIKGAGADTVKLAVVPIDAQDDFSHPKGTLFVAGRSGTGAVDDAVRLTQLLYRYLHLITGIFPTFDTHFALQVFSAPFWVGPFGEPLNPHTLIVADAGGVLNNIGLDGAVILRDVKPRPEMVWWLCGANYPWLVKQMRHYVEELSRGGKYTLYLWPPHTNLGTPGHAMTGVLTQARFFHSYVRGVQSHGEIKGGHPLSECYSVFGEEVRTRFDGAALSSKNTRFIDVLLGHDVVVFAGQAASHCVKSSIDDFLVELVARDPALAGKIYILEDCMSAVTVPDPAGGFAADFTDEALAALDRFRDAGMHVVRSTDPLDTWPDIPVALARLAS